MATDGPGCVATCSHEGISPDGVCCDCGMTITQLSDGRHYFTKSHTLVRSAEKSIREELNQLQLPSEVVTEAEKIHSQLQAGTHRLTKRKLLIFFCVSSAYVALGVIEDNVRLAQRIGLNVSDINKAFSMFSPSQTTYQTQPFLASPEPFMQAYMDALQFPDEFKMGALEKLRALLEKDPELAEHAPKKVAAGVLQYYMTIQGIKIKPAEYRQIVGPNITDPTIKQMYRLAYEIDNR